LEHVQEKQKTPAASPDQRSQRIAGKAIEVAERIMGE
jgi:hypothetical protein